MPAPRRRAALAARTGARLIAVRAHAAGGVEIQDAAVVHSDFLVLGSGIAGLTYALDVAEHGKVVVVTKDRLQESNTQYAQGGICGVFDAHDSAESHISDTVIAGAYLCNLPAVEVVCREGAAAVRHLVDLGAQFSADARTGHLHLAREGGHTHARVVHAADATGAEIERALVAAIRSHPNITVVEHHFATDLVTAPGPNGALWCLGVDVQPRPAAAGAAMPRRRRFLASSTLLATGGAGHVFPSTTNPSVATGDGMAMAFRAGATVANMEFVQFHPTALYEPPGAARVAPGTLGAATAASASAFLISEAVRGAGGRLFNGRGERFMGRYDQREELAPRDVVARSIDAECKRQGEPCVWLDISHRPAKEVLEHFPNIAAACAARGIDITRDRIPVVPAAHYFCGGVVTGLDGSTSIPGLYAAGEVACTGLHGANRLASNSLLEGVVFARRAAPAAMAHAALAGAHAGVAAAAREAAAMARAARALEEQEQAGHAAAEPPSSAPADMRAQLQSLMWRSAGIVRNTSSLTAGRAAMRPLVAATNALASSTGSTVAELELRNLAAVGDLVLRCALLRRESRGLHYTTDFPEPVESERRHSVICAEEEEVPLARARRGVTSAPARGGGSPLRGRRGGGAATTAPPATGQRRFTLPSELSNVPGKRDLVARAEAE